MKDYSITPPQRRVITRYVDPIEVIWVECASSLGWRVIRSGEAFASWDGANTLTLGRGVDLDADDHLGQMILHEVCHALIEGPSGWGQTDWGLCNIDARHLDRELACHRLQAFWADQVSLRGLFAVTTDWRLYYDVLPSAALDPLSTLDLERWCQSWSLTLHDASALDLRAQELARIGLIRAQTVGWERALRRALRDTRSIAHLMSHYVSAAEPRDENHSSLWYIDSRSEA